MEQGRFLTAAWRYLAMLNYEVDPALLVRLVPNGTELDRWNGRAYISMVGFMFLDTRVLGIPVPLHRNFEEVNLRFYVRRKGPEGWRRGVVFIREIVPRAAIATIARVVYNENYVAMPMRHRIDQRDGTLVDGGTVEYGWRFHGEWNTLGVDTIGGAAPLVAGSEEEFITEHYWGYAAQRDGGCVEYGVEHPSWRIWQVAGTRLCCDVERLYGTEFAGALASTPTSAFLADGSEIIVRKGIRI